MEGRVTMNKAKLNLMLDAVIGLAFAISAATGVAFMAMGDGGYQGGRNAGFSTSLLGLARTTWSDLHTWASLVMVAGVVVHLALHWRWIVCMIGKSIASARRPAAEQVCEIGA
jgi:hypothetical protein